MHNIFQFHWIHYCFALLILQFYLHVYFSRLLFIASVFINALLPLLTALLAQHGPVCWLNLQGR